VRRRHAMRKEAIATPVDTRNQSVFQVLGQTFTKIWIELRSWKRGKPIPTINLLLWNVRDLNKGPRKRG